MVIGVMRAQLHVKLNCSLLNFNCSDISIAIDIADRRPRQLRNWFCCCKSCYGTMFPLWERNLCVVVREYGFNYLKTFRKSLETCCSKVKILNRSSPIVRVLDDFTSVDCRLLVVMGRDFVSALRPVAYCTVSGWKRMWPSEWARSAWANS
jgi:hypothetical protein